MKINGSALNQQHMLSEHPVLEFLNTTPMVGGSLRDMLTTDADVLSLLARLGWPVKFKGTGLLSEARTLREELRHLIIRRKAAMPLRLAHLNKFLGEAKSHLQLRREGGDALAVDKVWEHRTARQVLAPVAEAAADLLATGDFELVRKCESETCVLWFYDRTRSHQRRWCSMASCGNRHKVAVFRKRRSDV